MSERLNRWGTAISIICLGIGYAAQCWRIEEMRAQRSRMFALLKASEDQCHQLILRANHVGFDGSLFGYEACRQGMDPAKFVDLSAQIFGGTNIPNIHVEISTNVELETKSLRRRL